VRTAIADGLAYVIFTSVRNFDCSFSGDRALQAFMAQPRMEECSSQHSQQGSFMTAKTWAFSSVFAFVLGISSLQAQEAATEHAPDPTWTAAMEAMVAGPRQIPFIDQAQFSIPEGYGFVPLEQAKPLMEKMGNQIDSRFIGLVFPLRDQAAWFVAVDYEPSGYIKDEDAKDWDSDELLQNLKDGTEEGNKHRAKIGVAPIEVTRWVEKPAYDAATHRLVWSAELREKGVTDPNPGVNYNTYVLGRDGYISMNLITSAATVEQDKPAAHQLLSAVNFVDGKRYTDFNSSTDKVAAYGLAALVGGVAAKKLGLLAIVAAFVVKFAKIIFIGVVAFGGAIAKFFKRKPSEA
jgi:uncharacterized membrane-anchored protein